MTVHVKTSLLIAMILTASLAIMGFLYLRFLERSLTNSIYVGLEGVSHAATDAVSKFLQSTHQAAQAVALDLPVRPRKSWWQSSDMWLRCRSPTGSKARFQSRKSRHGDSPYMK